MQNIICTYKEEAQDLYEYIKSLMNEAVMEGKFCPFQNVNIFIRKDSLEMTKDLEVFGKLYIDYDDERKKGIVYGSK